ncbi:unnamed protein product, partial [Tenebrio molitor]
RCTDAALAPLRRCRDNSNHRNGTPAQTATGTTMPTSTSIRHVIPGPPFPKSAHATSPPEPPAASRARKLPKQKINTDVLFRLQRRARQFTAA